ncbi:MAG TPA: type VI secretion system tube protein TssD, partial [Flavisolibacter sp.]
GGTINLSVESTDDTSIIESMVNQYKPVDGVVTFKKGDEDAKMKELSWEKGYIVRFQEGIDITGTQPMMIDFTISAEKISINDVEHKNEWPK